MRKFILIFLGLILGLVFLFIKTPNIYAQIDPYCIAHLGNCHCNTGATCYVSSTQWRCFNGTVNTGQDCQAVACPTGDSCQAVTAYTPNGNACQRLSVFDCAINVNDACLDSTGHLFTTYCSASPNALPGCTSDGTCMSSGGSCCNGASYSDATCGSGTRCGTASGGGGGGGTVNPPNGSCGSCSTCGDPNPNNCALINGVCSKAGYCGSGPLPSSAMGAVVFCQDKGGQYYPMPGVTLRTQAFDNQGQPISTTIVDQVTDNNGYTLFSNLTNAVGCGGNQTLGLGIQNLPNGTLPTGQSYYNLQGVSAWGNAAGVGGNCDTGGNVNYWSAVGDVPSITPTNGFAWGTCPNPLPGNPPIGYLRGYNAQICSWQQGKTLALIRFYGCSPPPTPTPNKGWWQVTGGDVVTNGDLISTIPSGCTLPACNPYLVLPGSGGFPGNTIVGGITGFYKNNISAKGWIAATSYKGQRYDYAYFNNIAASKGISYNILPAVAVQGNFDSGTAGSDGYYWYKSAGDLTLSGGLNVNGGKKMIVFVPGNLTVNNTINMSRPGFFMAIVSGNINVVPSQTPNNQYTLEGIYVANGQLILNASNYQFLGRGSFVAYGGFSLARDLGSASNTTTPAETFTYAPDLIYYFPRNLVQDTFSWQELVP